MEQNKLRVVWLCHFSNEEIKNLLKPNRDIKEFAPWMPMAIHTIEGWNDIEVHIVAPFIGICQIKEFELRGVFYHFYPALIRRPYKLFYNKLFRWDSLVNFKDERIKIQSIVKNISPDVIHLFGAENPYYSIAILDLIDVYPCILTVQGFVSNSPVLKGFDKRRAKIEQEIIKKIKTAFYESNIQAANIKAFNPSIKLFWHFYGSYEVKRTIPKGNEIYDLVFFARIERDKGIVDLLDAVKLLTIKRPTIRLIVIGGGNIIEFKEYAKKIGIDQNVVWAGFQPTREDVHKLASYAKISVLPTYHDINPGTIIESMFLEIPVVSYNVGTNPEINEKSECLKLVEKGNIKQLANSIDELLSSDNYRKLLADRAHHRAYEMYAPSVSTLRNCLLKGYINSIKNHNEYES